ncbi:hypothetical protein OAN34_04915 [Hyphomicrobiales bacterium]|nr:hypothetical protein [Hyphomicrobiales bacterium]
MYKSILIHIKSALPLFFTLGGIGGFIADILQPIAPFSSYVFFVSLGLTFVLCFLMYTRRNLIKLLAPFVIFSFSSMLFTGLLLGLGDETNKSNGVLASTFPALGSFQESLGLIQKDIEIIKEVTEEIKQTSAQTAKNTEKIAETLLEIQKGFSSLTHSGGIIVNPERPEQFYHNARIYELSGDYGNARRSYNRYFSFKLNHLDPHLRYQAFLKVQEGREGALEIYSEMYYTDKRMIVEFARILLLKKSTRLKILKKFKKKYPNFAPVYYQIHREYISKEKKSLKDRENQMDALISFINLNEKGKFLKYIIDNELALSWIQNAQNVLSSFERQLKNNPNLFKEPLSISQSNIINNSSMPTGWNIYVQIKEQTKEIFYKTNIDSDYISSGFKKNEKINTRLKNISYLAKTISIKYLDINLLERGPFQFNLLDINKEIIKKVKQKINSTYLSNSLSFREETYNINHGKEDPEYEEKMNKWKNCPFNLKSEMCKDFDLKANYSNVPSQFLPEILKTHSYIFFKGLTELCGIKSIRFGIDKDTPDQILETSGSCLLGSLRKKSLENSYEYIDIPMDTEFISLEILYNDDTSSNIIKINKKDNCKGGYAFFGEKYKGSFFNNEKCNKEFYSEFPD